MPLDAGGYLSRVVAPGSYYAFAFKRPGQTGISHRFFPQTQLVEAARWLRYYGSTHDVWVGVASYRDAAQTGIDQAGVARFAGKRTQANAEALKAFWYDADISRPGDGKDPARVWQSDLELVQWLTKAKAGGLPVPNLWIRSGYGIHLYWVLDAPLPAAQWLPYAQAFKALLSGLGAKGDIGISGDSARILRPPETFNLKVPDTPAPCYDMTPAGLPPAYPLQALLPLQAQGRPGSRSMLAAAKAGIERPPPYSFEKIAAGCGQVARSLAEGGEHDNRTMWHDLINLAYACRDPEAAHRIGNKHRKYTIAGTEKKWDETDKEHQGKDFGAPLCLTLATDSERREVCAACPHWGKIKSPYTLGKPEAGDEPDSMPHGFRQSDGAVERWDGDDWNTLIAGVLSDVQLLRYAEGGYRLTFDYTLGETVHHVGINEKDLHISAERTRASLVAQGVPLNRFNTAAFGDMTMAWIEELRRNNVYIEAPAPFGWATDENGEYLGLAVAGVFYRCDGTIGPAQSGDRKIRDDYTPKGDIAKWRAATEFVTQGRPELETLVAASFAAPLMEFVGESAILSVWSMQSGARKTSAFRAGSAVWCNPVTGMSAMRDTTNSVQHSLGETRIMPVYWDEIHAVGRDHIAAMVEMVFQITQGRGRSRLTSTIEQREVGHWRTLMALSANRPLSELVEIDRAHTNAGAVRVFEYQMEPAPAAAVLEASTVVAQVERNYGHAGRIYASWIVQHVADIRNFIEELRKHLGHSLKTVDPNERFHVATILGVVAGAWIANHLELVRLDPKAIYQHLVDKLLEQRAERHRETPIEDEARYLLLTFERFVSDCTDDLVVSQSFSPVGRPRAGLGSDRVKIIKRPGPQCARAMIHIGLDNRELRFDHNYFRTWCRDNKLSPKALLTLMEKLWPVEKVRNILGIGTDWSSGAQVAYWKVRLVGQLAHHLNWGTPNPDTTNVVDLPTRD